VIGGYIGDWLMINGRLGKALDVGTVSKTG